MFDHIGRKIMGLAKTIAYLGIAGSCIWGLSIWFNYLEWDEGAEGFFIGLLVAGIGSLVSWISSFMTYGFGKLVENSDRLVSLQNGTGDSFTGYGTKNY